MKNKTRRGGRPRSPVYVVIALFLTLLLNTAFANMATFQNSGENRYKSIRLTPEIYNHANRDLSDLRIRDDRREYVPFFIFNSVETQHADQREYPMTLIDAYTRYDAFYFDYRVSDIPQNRDIIATHIVFTTRNTGFAKHVRLYGSHDNIHWDFVQNDSLYRIDGHEKLFISFNRTQRYTHYRIRLDNNLERISFDSVTLGWDYLSHDRIYFVEEFIPEFTVEEEDRQTLIHIDGLRNMRLAAITIHTDSMFRRTVSSPFLNPQELYNLTFNDTSYTNTTLEYFARTSSDDIFTLTIYNGDDRPININGITVRYYADELVFEDRDSAYFTLHFSGDRSIRAPVYDIVSYRNEILRGDIDRLEMTNITFEEPLEAQEQDFTMIFNIAVVVVAVLLALLILMKLKKKA